MLVYSRSKFDLIDDPLPYKEVNQRGENRVFCEAVPKLGVSELVIGLNPFIHHTHLLPGPGALLRLYQCRGGAHKEETAA